MLVNNKLEDSTRLVRGRCRTVAEREYVTHPHTLCCEFPRIKKHSGFQFIHLSLGNVPLMATMRHLEFNSDVDNR